MEAKFGGAGRSESHGDEPPSSEGRFLCWKESWIGGSKVRSMGAKIFGNTV